MECPIGPPLNSTAEFLTDDGVLTDLYIQGEIVSSIWRRCQEGVSVSGWKQMEGGLERDQTVGEKSLGHEAARPGSEINAKALRHLIEEFSF